MRAPAVALSLVLAAACAAPSGPAAQPPDPAPEQTPIETRRSDAGGTALAPDGNVTSPAPVDAARAATDGPPAAPERDAQAVAPADAGPETPAPATALDCKAAKLCDDFEGYGLGMVPGAPWAATMQNGGTLVVDGTKPFSGTKSLHITTQGGSAQAYLTGGKPALPLADNNLHGRMMFFFVEPPAVTHYSIIRAMGAASAKPWYSIGGNGNPQHLLFSYSPNDFIVPSKTPWPANRWACMQWQFDGSPGPDGKPKNELRLWLDGQPIDDMTVTRATRPNQGWTAPTFQSLMVGFANCCASSVKVQLWIDDLAIDGKPIACPRKP